MQLRKIMPVLLLALVSMIVLAACGGENQVVETVSPPALPQENAPAAGAPASSENAYPPPVDIPIVSNQSPYPAPDENAPGQAVPAPEMQSPYPEPVATSAPEVAVTQPRPETNRDLLASDPTRFQLASGKLQLVEFFAFWDGASKSLAPVINSIAANYGDRMNFMFLDIDDPATKKFQEALGYRTQPHFFLLDQKGNVIKQWQGNVDVADIHLAIENALP
jgi:thioredoxin 1